MEVAYLAVKNYLKQITTFISCADCSEICGGVKRLMHIPDEVKQVSQEY